MYPGIPYEPLENGEPTTSVSTPVCSSMLKAATPWLEPAEPVDAAA
jgi:hypothetical protein